MQDAELYPVEGFLTYDTSAVSFCSRRARGCLSGGYGVASGVELDRGCRLFMDGEVALPYDLLQVSACADGQNVAGCAATRR